MTRLLPSAALFIFAWLFAASRCFAYDPNGVWSSSSGSTIQLWANMQQVNVTVSTPQGAVNRFNGWWTRFGEQFAYKVGNNLYSAAFNGANQIRVQSSSTYLVWNRGQPSAPPSAGFQAPNAYAAPNTAPSTSINGLWQSTSGSSVQLSTQGAQVFVTLVTRDGKRLQGSGRWLQPGYSFDYSLPGYRGINQATLINASQISVANSQDGRRNIWTRSDGTSAAANDRTNRYQGNGYVAPPPNYGNIRDSSRDVADDPSEFLRSIERNSRR